jgi:hypothetical protein
MFGWKEVYFGTNMQESFQKQNILRNQNIPFKTKTDSTSLRMSMNNLDGRSGALSRGGPALPDYYRIYVKNADVEYAKELLTKNPK